jgi:hypothetical protein
MDGFSQRKSTVEKIQQRTKAKTAGRTQQPCFEYLILDYIRNAMGS